VVLPIITIMMNDKPKPTTNEALRAQVIEKAIVKYITPGVTNNITEALRMYLKNDAGPDEQIPLFVTAPLQHALRIVFRTIRPTCDDCGTGVSLQNGAVDQTGRKWRTAWSCSKCGRIEYSDRTLEEWLKVMNDEIRDHTYFTTIERS